MTESELIVLRLLGEAKKDLDDPEDEGVEEIGLEEPESAEGGSEEEVVEVPLDDPNEEPDMDEFGMSKSRPHLDPKGEVDLVQKYIPLVYSLARKWMQRMTAKGVHVADVDRAYLVSAGTLALAKAAEEYDPNVGDFFPLATSIVKNAVSNAGRDYQRQSRATGAKSLFSIDQPERDSDAGETETRGDFMPSRKNNPSEEIENEEGMSTVEKVLASLNPTQREVMVGIQHDKTYQEIGDEMGLSRARIFQIVTKATQIMRERLRKEGITGFESGTGKLITKESLSEAEIRALLWLLEDQVAQWKDGDVVGKCSRCGGPLVFNQGFYDCEPCALRKWIGYEKG